MVTIGNVGVDSEPFEMSMSTLKTLDASKHDGMLVARIFTFSTFSIELLSPESLSESHTEGKYSM